ncbi:hypothetical protein J2777_004165 [Paraburkholderia graminis]|uniref:hypothetical protein n=1 Tax=Paraburkholderia graminis TaxID=60548 RepID=UPI00285845C8|nr:hypothetical protein [Paraburkholderia graminis]MDR6470426.1 hypothetical protein [Paraburkholderia graminis]
MTQMIHTREQIKQRLLVLVGLNVSGVGHAADMLTLQFGPIREITTKRQTIKRVGAWSLHIQCDWTIERGATVLAAYRDFAASETSTREMTHRIRDLVVDKGPTVVQTIEVGDNGMVRIGLSGDVRISITTDGISDEEDWRFFASGSDAKHFVITGGKVDPWSLS